MDPATRIVQRMDVGRLAKAIRTPQGGVEVDGALGKAGILVYRNADGSERREWLSPEEAQKADSLATLETAPVTLRHPPEMVGPTNFMRYNRGAVRAPRFEDGEIRARVVVQDGSLIKGIDSGELQELSLGYRCKVTYQPGVTPDGQHFDAVQTDREYNHVGVGPTGWARSRDHRGPATLRLDGDDNVVFDSQEQEQPMIVHLDGQDYDLSNPTAKAAFDKASKALQEAKAKAETERDEQRARADGAENKAKDLEGQLTSERDPAKRSAEAAAIAQLHTEAKRIAPAVKLDGLNTPRAIRQAALQAADKDAKLDGESDDYVRAAFEYALRAAPKPAPREDGVDRVRRAAASLPRADRRDEDGNDENRSDAVEASKSYYARLRTLSKDHRDSADHSVEE